MLLWIGRYGLGISQSKNGAFGYTVWRVPLDTFAALLIGGCCLSCSMMTSPAMRKASLRLLGGATLLATSLSLVACGGGGDQAGGNFDGEVKVGILHSRSGTMAISENTVAEAELMAIDEINAKGGITIDGKKLKIVPVEEDGASDWPTFAEKATKLIDQDQVAVVFGGWTSASRKAMLPVFEEIGRAHV